MSNKIKKMVTVTARYPEDREQAKEMEKIYNYILRANKTDIEELIKSTLTGIILRRVY